VSAPVAPGASEIANASEAVQDGRIYIERVGKIEVHNSLLNAVLHDKPEIKRDSTSKS
jgi:hypothetical protein